MKKIKWLAIIVASCALALCLVGCSGSSQDAQQQEAKDNGLSAAKTTDGIIEDIQNDFKTTKEGILSEESKAKEAAGDSFDSYVAGKAAITDWYASTQDASEKLFERTNQNAVSYYKLVASQGKSKDYSELKNEMTKFYRAVYEDEMTDFYRGIYQDAMSDMYDAYYAGVLQSLIRRSLMNAQSSIAPILMRSLTCTEATPMLNLICIATILMCCLRSTTRNMT